MKLINSSLPSLGFIELVAVEICLIKKYGLKIFKYSDSVPPKGGESFPNS